MCSISSGNTFSFATRNNSHLPCWSLRMHMAWARVHDSYAGGGRSDPSPLPYHLGFMVGLSEWGLSSTYNFKMVHIPFFFSVLDGAKKLNNIVSWSLLSLFCCRLTVPKGGCIIALYPNFISKDISSLIWVSRSKLVGYCCSCFLQNANNSIWTNQRWALWGLAQRTWWNNHKEETDMWKSQGPTASVQGL
jgi:hypothetical protein